MQDNGRDLPVMTSPGLDDALDRPLNPAAMLTGASKPEMDERQKVALAGVVAILKQSGMSAEAQTAVALNAAVFLLTEVPGVAGRRGKVINAMTDEFRKRLQLYLPLGL